MTKTILNSTQLIFSLLLFLFVSFQSTAQEGNSLIESVYFKTLDDFVVRNPVSDSSMLILKDIVDVETRDLEILTNLLLPDTEVSSYNRQRRKEGAPNAAGRALGKDAPIIPETTPLGPKSSQIRKIILSIKPTHDN